MVAAIEWTGAMDAHLLAGRRGHRPWHELVRDLGVCRSVAMDRFSVLGGRKRAYEGARQRREAAERLEAAVLATRARPMPDSSSVCDSAQRGTEALPAGHPLSWGLLIALTPTVDPAWPGYSRQR